MTKRFTVWDCLHDQEMNFSSEAKADAYLLRRKNEVAVDMRRDEPGRNWTFYEVFCVKDRKEYWLMENEEPHAALFSKWPTE